MSLVYDRINKLCELHEMSIGSLEKLLKFGNGTIRAWEGTAFPRLDKLYAIAEFFETSVGFLVDGFPIELSIEDEGEDFYAEMIKTFSSADERTKKAICMLLCMEDRIPLISNDNNPTH